METFIGSKMFLTFFNVKYDSAYLTTEIWDWFDILSVLEKKSINAGRRLLKYFFIKMCFSVSKMMTFWFLFHVLIVVHFAKSFFFWPSIWHAMIWKDLKEKLRKILPCSKNRPIELLSQDGTFAVHAHISLFDLTTFWFALYNSLCFLIGQACYCCHRYGSILEILQNHWVVKTRKTWRHQLSWYWKRKSKSDNPPTAESCLLK